MKDLKGFIKTKLREFLNERKLERFDYLFELLKSYNLPNGEYAVFGSAPLAITGMVNDVSDFDVIIKPRSWDFESDNEYRTEDIEFFDNWPGFDVDDLIDNYTFEFRGVLFVNPEKVIEYKRKMNRPKDQDFLKNLQSECSLEP
jgi:hypothetical protein